MKTIKDSAKWLFVILLFINACDMEMNKEEIKKQKSEVMETEQNFAEMVKNEEMAKAFLNYAAEDAVLSRNNTLIKGKEEIRKYFVIQPLTDIKLEWTPDFVDVAKSGDLAYTYGKYTFTAIDSNGETINSKGIFHTVWKKQSDGTWKYVWD